MQPIFGVLHMPSTSNILEQTYESILDAKDPDIAVLLLLFSIFSGAALAWTPNLLEQLDATQEQVKAAFIAYTRLAMSILDSSHYLPASTTTLTGTATLAHVIINADGFRVKNHIIWTRCLLMAREMQIHRLDTIQSHEERRLTGCNMIEIEVQRRVWWNMVAFDW